ncbi:MAG: tetratricopeptide repeat protein [Chloroflexota bacterium]|nr:tetratricopeptide repeat protein [Chloroflexota bacterium]PLS78064.1 MAG: hypothetical protein CYG59_20480 [Chloroflexota bacterium]
MAVLMPGWTRTRLTAALITIAALVLVPLAVKGVAWQAERETRQRLFQRGSHSLAYGTDETITTLQQQLRDNPREFAPHIALAHTYLQKVRETGDPSLYTKVESLLNSAEKIDGQQPDLFATRGILALARHDFAGALKLGKQALILDTENPQYYGIVADAQIELGKYDEAIKSLQTMVEHRPDFSSYSRIAYARELYGDPEGAMEAMQFAIDAGGPVPENISWAYVQLGNLSFGMGNLDEAGRNYDLALQRVENYPAALAGQARVATATGDLRRAASLYQQAFDRVPLAEYAIALGDVYTKLGDEPAAQRQYDLVKAIDQLLSTNGVNTDMETALFFADHNIDLPQSLVKARAAYAARPSVHAADALAWTLYRTGNYAEAQTYAAEALKLSSYDSLKLFHAGMIANALGQRDQAQTYLQQALNLNPHFSLLWSDLAQTTLKQLASTPATKEGQ